jgi:hypothetical protein
MNTDIIQRSTNYVDLNVTKELEDRGFDVFAKESNEDNDNICSTKRSKLSTVSDNNPAFNSNMSELQDGQSDYTQSPQLGPAAASLDQSDLKTTICQSIFVNKVLLEMSVTNVYTQQLLLDWLALLVPFLLYSNLLTSKKPNPVF